MKAILDTLHERHNAWKDAYELAKSDPNIDLNRIPGPQLVEGDLYATVRTILSFSTTRLIQNRRNSMGMNM